MTSIQKDFELNLEFFSNSRDVDVPGGDPDIKHESEPEICFPCFPRHYEWFVKIRSNYGEVKYISSYHSRSLPTTVEDIFNNLILPVEKDRVWHIDDYDNLYDINSLPEEYYESTNDPDCDPGYK